MSRVSARRVVTGHDAAGRAIFIADDQVVAEHLRLALAKGDQSTDVISLWSTGSVPANNSSDEVTTHRLAEDAAEGHVFDDAITFRIAQLPPRSSSPMHRTHSVDYGILLSGACDLVLDGGQSVRLRAGDVVIQRGTSHSWVNRGEEPCRLAWILVAATPVTTAAGSLPETWRAAPDL